MPDAEELEYGYKVELEEFSGPLDLLLYLIRQEEVDITNIPIARITDQYLAHIDVLQMINVNLAGEFLLMAATLMEIKSRMLLPRPETDEEEEEDPRADLIRQLIEYKKYKDAARQLAGRADEQALKYGRGAGAVLGLPERAPEEDLPILIGELTAWDLVSAFRTILRQTSVLDAARHIVLDDKPLTDYCNDLLDRLRERGTVTFGELFARRADRMALISTFLALLELMRRRRLRAEQGESQGEIRIVVLDATPVTAVELIETPVAAEAQPPAEAEPAPVAAEAAPQAPPQAPAKPWRRHRPTADLPLLTEGDDEFGIDQIEVPEVRLEPEPAAVASAVRPAARALRRHPVPTILALLARRGPSRRRVGPVAIPLNRPTRRPPRPIR